jgi:hypothetical protein
MRGWLSHNLGRDMSTRHHTFGFILEVVLLNLWALDHADARWRVLTPSYDGKSLPSTKV